MSDNKYIKNKQKLFIEPLEQRIMLDGAAASTFLDLIDERNQSFIKTKQNNAENIIENKNSDNEIPFTNVAKEKVRNDKKNIVFIDSAVEDYETITSSFKKNTEFYLINSNEDGFKRINEILKNKEDIDALHLIGHGSAGQILFGNTFLNNETIDNYKSTLSSIGQSLTTSGDILFYGCNVASTYEGEILIKKISEITKADIAASDDITGKDGDWDLEKEEGFIDVKELNVRHYDHSLDTLTTSGILANSGVEYISTTVDMLTSSETKMGLHTDGIYSHLSDADTKYAFALERTNVSVANGKIISNIDIDTTDTGLRDQGSGSDAYISGDSNQTASSAMTVNSYLMAYVGNDSRLSESEFGSVVFNGEIVGIFFDQADTRGENIDGVQYYSSSFTYDMRSDNNGGSAPTHSSNQSDSDGGRLLENPNFYNSNQTSDSVDWVSVGDHGSGTNNYLSFGSTNNSSKTGDYIRILVKNSAPSATADTGYIQEGKTLTVANDASANDADSSSNNNDATGDHTGDVLGNDTDADSDSLTVTTYTHTSSAGQGGANTTPGSPASGTAGTDSVAGTYGTLDLEANGSYTYTANSNITNLDVDDETFTDVFTYTVSDGNGGTDTATITITIEASGDLTARNDTGTINAGATLTVSDGDNESSASVSFDANNSTSASSNPVSVIFNTDGTKMYWYDNTSRWLYQYALSTAFDVSTKGSATSHRLSYVAKEILFSNDGTKLFILTGSNLNEHSLTTPFDISTLSSSIVQAASLGQNETAYSGFTFNNDGTKMFAVGTVQDRVQEFSLSSAFDVSSMSHVDSVSVNSQDSTPHAVRFNHDGTKMFISGQGNRSIFEYTLSSAFDISSTLTLKGSLSVSTSDGNNGAYGFSFNNDGTKLFTTGINNDRINEYSLTTPFSLVDISGEHSGDVIHTNNTDSYDNDPDSDTLTVTAIRTGSVEGSGTSGTVGQALTGSYGNLTIAANGSYTYAVADNSTVNALDSGDVVTDTFNYTVSDGQGETDIATITITITAINDDPTATADTDTVTAAGTVTDETNGAGTLVSDDTDPDASSSLYVTKITHTNGNSSEATYGSTKSSNAVTIAGSKGTLTFGSDGSYSYTANLDVTTGPDVFTYTLSDGTATDTATLTIDVVVNHFGYIQEGKTLTVANTASLVSGTSTGSNTGDIIFNDTSDTYTVTHIQPSGGSTTSVNNVTYNHASATSVNGTYGTLTIGSDGSYKYVANSNISGVNAGGSNVTDTFTYTENTGSGNNTKTLTIYVIPSQDLTARNDTGTINVGATLTVSDGDNESSASVSFDANNSTSASSNPVSVIFNTDGTKMYWYDNTSRWLYQYALSTAFDVSTKGSATSHRLSYVAKEILFSNDGTKLFILTGSNLNEHSLTTPFDISTLSSSIVQAASLGQNETAYSGFTFNNDGTKMFAVGTVQDRVQEFSLSSAFDVSSMSHVDSVSVNSQDSTPHAVRFNHDGTKMFISGQGNRSIFEYTLSSAFDISSTLTLKGSLSVSTSDGNNGAYGFSFNNDGTKLFTTGINNDRINEYSLTTPFSLVDISGEHSGDVIHTNNTDSYDNDPDSDTLTVTAIRTGSVEGSGTSGTVGQALTGSYGNLTIAANGSYTYAVADNSTVNALDSGDVVTDTFNYTVSDGQGETDIATITITITAINDDPTATADTDTVTAAGTVTDETNGAGTLVSDDTDPDASSSLYVTKITHTNGNSSEATYGSTKSSNAVTIAGSKGTLTFGSDGSYSYTANLDVTTGPDVFTYTLSDGTATDTATLTIDVVVNHFGYIQEGKTLTVANTASLVSGTSTGSNTGDIIFNDTSDTYTVTHIQPSGGSTTSVNNVTYNHASATSVNGTYGTLTIGSDGSYKYVANSNISGVNAGGSNVTDTFTYTENTGSGNNTKTLTIYVIPSQDLTARNDTGTINVGATLTVSDGDNESSASVSFDANNSTSASSNPVSVIFNTDGTKMYWYDNTSRWLYQYALSTAFDVSTKGSATSHRLSYVAKEILFSNDGTKLFILTGSNLNEHSLTTPFDISTLSSSIVQAASLGQNETAYSGFTFNNDGTKMFAVGTVQDRVQEFSLSSAFDVSSMSHVDSVSVNSQDSTPHAVRFNHDGTKMFISGQGNRSIFEYTLSSAFDISSTLTLKGSLSVSTSDGNNGAYGFSFNNDGTKLFTTGINNDRINEYSLTTPFSLVDISGEHSGDVIHTNNTDSYDNDPDSDTLTVTAIRTGSVEGSGTSGTVGQALTGSYGNLTIAANGSYTYAVADNSTVNALDSGDVVTDTFNYTVSDGQGETDIATITITVIGVNDTPVADNETGSVGRSQTLTVTDGTSDLLNGDTDSDTSASLRVSSIVATTANGSATIVNPETAYNSGYTQVNGSYGTLRVGADGTYQYIAGSNNGTDVFTYTLSDGTATDTATLTITVAPNSTPSATNDTDAVNEDATITESSGSELLVADDTDADSDTLTVTQIAVTGGSNSSVAGSSTYNSNFTSVTGTYGTLKVGADGSYTYVADQSAADDLDLNDQVTDSFTYTVSDGTATDTATLIITVTGINDAPVADNETGAVNEDATLTVTDGTSDVLHGDTDADDSASLTVSAIRTGAEDGSGTSGSIGSGLTGTYGTLTLASDGTYTYVADQSASDDLDANDTATDTFTYTVSDGTATDTGTITITVTGVNDAPVAVNDTDAVNEDATVTRSSGSSLLMDDDSDADDDDSFTVTQIAVTGSSNNAVTANSTYNSGSPETVTGTYGQLTVGADGTYTYVANQSAADDLDANDTATDSFTYTISDGDATDTATLIFTVTGVNDVPTASDKTVNTNEDTAYVFSASDFGYTDADDDDALVSIKITTLEDAGALQYYNGSDWVDVTLNQVITATDIAANKLRFNPAADENGSSYTTFNFTVNDGDSDSSTPNTITVNVTAVNDAPVADNETGVVNEDATLTVTDGTSDVLHGDTDVDSGDTLTVTQIAVTGGSNSSVAGSSTYNSNFTTVTGTYGTLKIGADGTYTYVADQSAADDLDASDTATDSFTYTVSDGTATDTATIIITVTGVNDAPVAVNDTDSVNEDATVTRSSGSSLLMADDSDADDDDSFTVTQIAVTGGSNSAVSSGSSYNSSGTQVVGTYGTLTVGADGTYTYIADQSAADDLDANDTATDSFTYTISDGDATDTATLIFTVTGVNDTPVAVNDTDAVNEDATVTRSSGSNLLMADDSDADDDDSFTVTQIAVTGSSNSAVSSGTNQSNGTSVTGTYGTLTVGANGTYTYVADQSAADDLDANDTATDSFTYTISDGDATDTATLIFTVTGVNDAPVAVNDTDAVNEDATVTRSSGSNLLMADDSDADDDDSFTVTQIAVTGGSNSAVTSGSSYNSNGRSVTGTYGTLTVGADGTYTYVADQSASDDLDANDTATDSFTYTISDGDATDTATLIFTVTGINDAPVADNETGAVNEDATLTVSDGTSDLLHGDTDADDSASLTITTYSHTSATDESGGSASSGNGNSGTAGSSAVVGYYGTLTLAADGTYTYAADQNVTDALDASDTVTDVFTYTLSDGTATDTATLTITITGVNDAPVAVADTDTVQLTDTVTNSTNAAGTVISDDTDADSSSSLSVTSITATTANGSAQTTFSSNTETVTGSYGTLTINSNGSYSYVAGSSVGTDVFTYIVSDGSLTSSTTLTFSVTLGNPPVAANDTDSVNEDATVTQSTGSSLLLADDTDADGNTLTVTQIAVTGGSNSAVTASSITLMDQVGNWYIWYTYSWC